MTAARRALTSKPRKKRVIDPDCPPLTAKQLRAMRPSIDVVPHIVNAFRRSKGLPEIRDGRVTLTFRIDPKILEAYQETGWGWHHRMHDVLAANAPMKTVKRKPKSKPTR